MQQLFQRTLGNGCQQRMRLPVLAQVWRRLAHVVPQEVRIGPDCPPVHGISQAAELAGIWSPVGVNQRWRVVCYPYKGHFGPHRDGDYVPSKHERSFLTINGYLSAVPAGYGGATRFLSDEQPLHKDDRGRLAPLPGTVLHEVLPDVAGKSVLFWHGLMHDGQPLADGCPAPKWLYRSEVMYRRDPGTAPVEHEWTAIQAAARKLVAEVATFL